MYPLKQSTAIIAVIFAHDANGDGVTGIADGSWTKRLSKGSGAFAAMTVTIAEMENGFYSVPLSTAHTDTLGILTASFSAAGAKRVNVQYRIHAQLPDDLASQASVTTIDDFLDTEVAAILAAVDTEVAAIKAKTDQLTFTAVNKVDSTIQAAGDFAQAAADKVWATATRALTDKVGFALSAAGIQAIWDALTSALTTASSIGKLLVDNINATISSRSTQTSVDTVAGYIDTEVSAVLAAVDTEIGAIKAVTDALPNAGALTTIQADLDNIQTRIPAALIGGRIDSTASAIDGDANAAGSLRRAVLGNVLGTVGAGSSTTSLVTSSLIPSAAVADQYKGRIVVFDRDTATTTLRGQATDITASTAGGVLTVTALTAAPASGDTFTIT